MQKLGLSLQEIINIITALSSASAQREPLLPPLQGFLQCETPIAASGITLDQEKETK